MKYIEMTKTIATLSDRELEHIMKYGHLGVATNTIAELWQFYISIEEEYKRRELKRKELQKVLPIDKYFKVNTNSGSFMFKVIECHSAPQNMHITHYCHIVGYKILDNELRHIETKYQHDFQIDDSIEFGWNSKRSEIIFWTKGSIAPYETIEIDKEQYDKYLRTLELLGFDIDTNDIA